MPAFQGVDACASLSLTDGTLGETDRMLGKGLFFVVLGHSLYGAGQRGSDVVSAFPLGNYLTTNMCVYNLTAFMLNSTGHTQQYLGPLTTMSTSVVPDTGTHHNCAHYPAASGPQLSDLPLSLKDICEGQAATKRTLGARELGASAPLHASGGEAPSASSTGSAADVPP